jgi:hypothetical protein
MPPLWLLVVPLLVVYVYVLLLPWLERHQPPLDCNRHCPLNGRRPSTQPSGDESEDTGQP